MHIIFKELADLDLVTSKIREKLDTIDQAKEKLIEETIRITEIAAPLGKEEKRANYVRSKFEQLNYQTKIDKVGNVLATKDFKALKYPLVVSAHLDTVFDTEEIKVKRDGDILYGPGVGDDSRGLVNLVCIAELLREIEFKLPILYVATVGEEGRGDLLGAKNLFKELKNNCAIFITIDGAAIGKVIDSGIGSYRYVVDYNGPGGHSYGSFGLVNPAYALGVLLCHMADIKVPEEPRTTFSAGIVEGGTSINSIPTRVSVQIDLRSESSEELEKLDQKFKAMVADSIEKENANKKGELDFTITQVGNRPTGALPDGSIIHEAIRQVNQMFNQSVEFMGSSTDANIPLSMGIPGISIAGVDTAEKAHTLDEWIDAGNSSLMVIKRNLMLIALLADSII